MSTFKTEKTAEVSKEQLELSDSEDEDLEVLTTKEQHDRGGKELNFKHTDRLGLCRDLEVPDGQAQVYHIEVSEFTRNKPDITLHAGQKGGPVVAASHYAWSRSFKCGIGADETSMQWTEMKRSGMFGTSRFAFEWKGRMYRLQRAKSEDTKVTGLSRLLITHFKVVEENSGELIALYISGLNKGTMTLKPGLTEDLEALCVLGVASWRDKLRRQRANGGGGA